MKSWLLIGKLNPEQAEHWAMTVQIWDISLFYIWLHSTANLSQVQVDNSDIFYRFLIGTWVENIYKFCLDTIGSATVHRIYRKLIDHIDSIEAFHKRLHKENEQW